MEEQILVVPTELFHSCGYFEGYVPMSEAYLPLFNAENQSFALRSSAETDPSLKQLIPYIMVVRGSGLLLNYVRGKGQGEARLHGRRSVGIGGHINPCDLSDSMLGVLLGRPDFLDDKYLRGMLRELNEELLFARRQGVWNMRLAGLINDDSTEVGKVHLGIVHVLFLDFGTTCTPNEKDIIELRWDTTASLRAHANKYSDEYESWSRICLQYVDLAKEPRRKKALQGARVSRHAE